MNFRYITFYLVSLILLLNGLKSYANGESLYNEPYRSQYHFTPEKGWMGDPSGLMFYQGKYHLFWWGKAESTDLVHYTQITPNAMIGESENIKYFTGSAVVDKNNTAGYGNGAYIAAYTLFEKDSKKQAQGISFSHDGKVFHYYDKNPVLDLWSTEFRDPTVFWHEETSKWIMVVVKALERKVQFYSSDNLKEWTWLSDFGPSGDNEKSWECPDLFQVSIDGDPQNKLWVLVVSVNWAKEQYFIGNFDGKNFKLMENHPKHALYIDKGLDFYASRTFQDFDGTLNKKISMGWVSTWDYALKAPSTYGKGLWSIPREYKLKTYKEGIRLTQTPIKELESLRRNKISKRIKLKEGIQKVKEFCPSKNVYELDVTFSTDISNTFGFNLCVGNGKRVVLSYDTDSHNFVIDRTNCSAEAIDPKFKRMSNAIVEPVNNKIRFHIFVDKSSVEIFANDGKDVFSLLTYPSEKQNGIEIFSLRKGTIMEFNGWKLNSIW